MDSEGKKVYSSKEEWELLGKEGLATKNDDGSWESILTKEELKKKFGDQKSFSAGILNQRYTNNPTNPNPIPTKNAVIDNSLLSELSKGSGGSLPSGKTNDTTK